MEKLLICESIFKPFFPSVKLSLHFVRSINIVTRGEETNTWHKCKILSFQCNAMCGIIIYAVQTRKWNPFLLKKGLNGSFVFVYDLRYECDECWPNENGWCERYNANTQLFQLNSSFLNIFFILSSYDCEWIMLTRFIQFYNNFMFIHNKLFHEAQR